MTTAWCYLYLRNNHREPEGLHPCCDSMKLCTFFIVMVYLTQHLMAWHSVVMLIIMLCGLIMCPAFFIWVFCCRCCSTLFKTSSGFLDHTLLAQHLNSFCPLKNLQHACNYNDRLTEDTWTDSTYLLIFPRDASCLLTCSAINLASSSSASRLHFNGGELSWCIASLSANLSMEGGSVILRA